jgi:hypothetical protein
MNNAEKAVSVRQQRGEPPSGPALAGGQALPLALVALAVGVIVLTLLILTIGVYTKLSSSSAGDLLDYYAADAGIERALAPLSADPNAYPASASLSLTLNGRTVSVAIAPLGTQIIADPTGGLTKTITSYMVTSQASRLAIRARSEATRVHGQSSATIRISAWRVGQ